MGQRAACVRALAARAGPGVRSLPVRPLTASLLSLAAISLASAPARSSAQAAPAAVQSPAPAASHEAGPGQLVVTGSVGAGGELGLANGEKAGVVEIEVTGGYEFRSLALRPELGLTLGLAPDTHFAIRPGIRWTLPDMPIQLRAALDFANSRGETEWRWLLLGAAVELRLTGVFGLYAGVDSGVPLAAAAGVPFLVRVGASFRL